MKLANKFNFVHVYFPDQLYTATVEGDDVVVTWEFATEYWDSEEEKRATYPVADTIDNIADGTWIVKSVEVENAA